MTARLQINSRFSNLLVLAALATVMMAANCAAEIIWLDDSEVSYFGSTEGYRGDQVRGYGLMLLPTASHIASSVTTVPISPYLHNQTVTAYQVQRGHFFRQNLYHRTTPPPSNIIAAHVVYVARAYRPALNTPLIQYVPSAYALAPGAARMQNSDAVSYNLYRAHAYSADLYRKKP